MQIMTKNVQADGPSVSAGAGGFSLLRRHMPELDVLRGVAVLMVVLYHGFYWMNRAVYSQPWQTFFVDSTIGGWLGVNLFFILSGFLITGILLDSKEKPHYYRTFYTKRALRILPALAAALMLALVFRQTSVAGAWLAIAFLVNYAPALGVFAYVPLWSLAVEEHFYLLWPAVVHRFRTRTITVIAAALCIVEPILRGLSRSLHLGDPHVQTHLVLDYLASGALLAVFARSRFASRANSMTLAFILILAGTAILAIGAPHRILHRDNAWGDALQVEPFNLIFAGTLLLLLTLRLRVFAGPLFSPMRYLGYISYGLYLYHLIIFVTGTEILARWNILQGEGDFPIVVARFLLLFAVAIVVSAISRRWLEQPFLNLKSRVTVEGRALKEQVERGGASA